MPAPKSKLESQLQKDKVCCAWIDCYCSIICSGGRGGLTNISFSLMAYSLSTPTMSYYSKPPPPYETCFLRYIAIMLSTGKKRKDEFILTFYCSLYREFSSKDLRNVGNYNLGKLIGKGSFGKVYLATHKLTNGSKVLSFSRAAIVAHQKLI